jgi:hypothetical protein
MSDCEDDYYDEDFHEFSGELNADGSLKRGAEAEVVRDANQQQDPPPQYDYRATGGDGGADFDDYSRHDDGNGSDGEGDEEFENDDHIETEVDPKTQLLKLGQPIENIRDERLEISGNRFKFPDELSRDDVGGPGDNDHFRDIYASPAASRQDPQHYIESSIQQQAANNNQDNSSSTGSGDSNSPQVQ